MKQTAQKKPKTFRTLIRQTHSGNKKMADEDKSVNKVENVDSAGKERKKQPSSFFGQ
ncbi:hypothetical protein [Dehalobacter sp. TeCB1]|uniref:hypothetical protein n=1 Tax=Dehalobacter sp. TeCB1 TaxID=1843715 RepID=UPI00159F2DB6|nr:hypothetical protein [Dehalobacter sp. TeCB1]